MSDRAAEAKTDAVPRCTEQQFVRCEVMIPHVRTINGTQYMLEPMFSGIVALPDDEDTRMSVAGGLLRVMCPEQRRGDRNE